jgi:hypothetical protein
VSALPKRIKVGDLSRGFREDMFNLHAVFTDNDANEQKFYQRKVPLRSIDLTKIDPAMLYLGMSDEDCQQYLQAMNSEPELKIMMISQCALLDGMHRITAMVRDGQTRAIAADFTGLVDIAAAGSICPVTLIDDRSHHHSNDNDFQP